jgi:hypothetical protein
MPLRQKSASVLLFFNLSFFFKGKNILYEITVKPSNTDIKTTQKKKKSLRVFCFKKQKEQQLFSVLPGSKQ